MFLLLDPSLLISLSPFSLVLSSPPFLVALALGRTFRRSLVLVLLVEARRVVITDDRSRAVFRAIFRTSHGRPVSLQRTRSQQLSHRFRARLVRLDLRIRPENYKKLIYKFHFSFFIFHFYFEVTHSLTR